MYEVFLFDVKGRIRNPLANGTVNGAMQDRGLYAGTAEISVTLEF
jgi:hypothetical protein